MDRLTDVSQHPFLRPSENQQLELWDVARRPEVGSYRFHGVVENKYNPQQIRCIRFSDCVGLSFICAGRVVCGIHAHRNHHASAADTFLSLSLSAQKVALLQYFPLNADHEIINGVWVRESEPVILHSRAIMVMNSNFTCLVSII